MLRSHLVFMGLGCDALRCCIVCRYQLPDEQKAQLVKMFDHAFDCCSAALLEAHKALIALDKDNARAYATK